jgi:hypothetical protein
MTRRISRRRFIQTTAGATGAVAGNVLAEQEAAVPLRPGGGVYFDFEAEGSACERESRCRSEPRWSCSRPIRPGLADVANARITMDGKLA